MKSAWFFLRDVFTSPTIRSNWLWVLLCPLAYVLPEIPGTGMMAYPDYKYYLGEEARAYKGNPWILYVFTPNIGINFDRFYYFPKQNYPETGYGGGFEKIRDWAYLHE